jgi:hypothetical protein
LRRGVGFDIRLPVVYLGSITTTTNRKEYSMGWQIVEGESFIVQARYNGFKDDDGVFLCGPFASRSEAEDFARNYRDEPTGIEEAVVQYVNVVRKVADE